MFKNLASNKFTISPELPAGTETSGVSAPPYRKDPSPRMTVPALQHVKKGLCHLEILLSTYPVSENGFAGVNGSADSTVGKQVLCVFMFLMCP